MESNEPSVSVIMPVKDGGEHLRISIASILKQSYGEVNEIILGVGPSSDDTHQIVNELKATEPRIKIIQNPSGKTANALNAAASIATGDYLVRVDTHCKLERDYIQQAIETMIRTGAANVGGIQKAEGTSTIQKSIAVAMTSQFGVGNSQFHYGGSEGPADTVYLGVYDTEVFRGLGGFNEDLVRNQDYELNIRIRASGNTVWFDPKLIVNYSPRRSIPTLFRQYFQYGQWKRVVIKMHPSSIKVRQIAAPALVLSLLFGLASSLFLSIWGLGIPCIYFATVLLASLISKTNSLKERLCLLLIFPTMHIAWGFGFLFGPQQRPSNSKKPSC